MNARMLVLRFPKEIVDKPIITYLVRDYNLTFNILKAQIYPRKEGMLVMDCAAIPQNMRKVFSTSRMSGSKSSRLPRVSGAMMRGATNVVLARRFAQPVHCI
jgi:ABC-type methionine transport system ATPase subunit